MSNQYEEISLDQLRPSPTNPRKRFDPVKLSELADSIEQLGVLQPLVVAEPGPGVAAGPDEFEIVAGERRWRAAQEAGLVTAPCRVGVFTRQEIVEIQAVENLQREDLDPIEEAHGYQMMLDLKDPDGKPVYSVRKLAERLGVDPMTISRRVDLLKLPAETQALVGAGKLAAKTASLVARIPGAAERNKAALEISDPEKYDLDHWNGDGEPLNYKQAADYIQTTYARSLRGAPFDPKDATLCPEAGACEACPNRSGNCKDAFPDLEREDMCLDTACFAEKADLANARLEAEAASKGREVVSGSEIFQGWSDEPRLHFDSDFVMLNQKPEAGIAAEGIDGRKLKPWSSLIKDQEVPVVVARHDKSGQVRELVRFDLALAAALENGHKPLFRPEVSRRHESGRTLTRQTAAVDPKQEDKLDRERRKERDASARRKRILTRAFDALADAVSQLVDLETMSTALPDPMVALTGFPGHALPFWQSLRVALAWRASFDATNWILARHGITPPDGVAPFDRLREHHESLIPEHEPVAALELLFADLIRGSQVVATEDAFRLMLAAYTVDLSEIEDEVDDEIAAEAKAKKAKAAKKKTAKKSTPAKQAS